MNLRYLIREIVEQKSVFQDAQIRFNKLTGNELKFSQKSDYQYIATIPKKGLGVFGAFINKIEILMTIFNTGSGNYSITFQVYWENKAGGIKSFVCNLNTLKVSNNKYSWIKNK